MIIGRKAPKMSHTYKLFLMARTVGLEYFRIHHMLEHELFNQDIADNNGIKHSAEKVVALLKAVKVVDDHSMETLSKAKDFQDTASITDSLCAFSMLEIMSSKRLELDTAKKDLLRVIHADPVYSLPGEIIAATLKASLEAEERANHVKQATETILNMNVQVRYRKKSN